MAETQTLEFTEEELKFLLGLFQNYHAVHIDGNCDYQFLPQWLLVREANLHNKIYRALKKATMYP
ncbi:MAG TPA: hypothetical protein VJH89_02065 [Patescibacteria group bacterium]|nr:hypothetical protein [Patescibacteria group bacterium]